MTKTQKVDSVWPAAELAAKQIKRLAQMKNYPRGEDEAQKELARALQSAKSLEQATGIITEILALATADTRCPMPGEIRAACKALQLDPQPDPLCTICGGDGWRTIMRGGLSGSERCRCWAPRPAQEWDRVPLAGSPGYDVEVAAKKMTLEKPGDEDRAETQKLAAKTHVEIGTDA